MPLCRKISKKSYLNLKHKFKKTSCITKAYLMCCACSFLQSGGLVCLATLRGSCLHSGGSWHPRVPSLIPPLSTTPFATHFDLSIRIFRFLVKSWFLVGIGDDDVLWWVEGGGGIKFHDNICTEENNYSFMKYNKIMQS